MKQLTLEEEEYIDYLQILSDGWKDPQTDATVSAEQTRKR